MPAWKIGKDIGIKLIVVAPDNPSKNLSTIQGSYLLLDGVTGVVKAMIEAKTLTNIRTAAASALASSFLSIPESRNLLIIGTGALAPYLIQAHASVRPIRHVYIWGRHYSKAETLAHQLKEQFDTVVPIKNIADGINQADIISCATSTYQPLLEGRFLKEGQHIDLVGSFKPDMREADDEVIRRVKLYVDILAMAPKESGDLAIPLQNNLISLSDITGDLFQLCQESVEGRTTPKSITLFKSVGHALEDLVAARLAFNQIASRMDHL